MNRLNFLLKDQCRTEARLSENSASLNMKLLENILPSHVAEYFLTDQAKDQVVLFNTFKCPPVFFSQKHLKKNHLESSLSSSNKEHTIILKTYTIQNLIH